VSALDTHDEYGKPNDWYKYVEFWGRSAQTSYSGYAGFSLLKGIKASSITSMQVQVNYQGPGTATQIWTWSLYNWVTDSWVNIGNNAAAPDWGPWTMLAFNIKDAFADYFSPAGALRLGLKSNNAKDNADIDYEAAVITSTGS
jgi:hypothetical protein